jgi:hypothetical protein
VAVAISSPWGASSHITLSVWTPGVIPGLSQAAHRPRRQDTAECPGYEALVLLTGEEPDTASNAVSA